MHKLLFAIFAHPDDESFGPCGTLIKEVSSGTELHLFSLTLGEAGCNPDNLPNLKQVRKSEWQEAGKLIGAKSLNYLGFKDSKLNNQDLQKAGDLLVDKISKIIKDNPKGTTADFMTFDLNGLSGHIDHITASRATSFAFYKLKSQKLPVNKIWYYCLPKSHKPSITTHWLFAEQGRTKNEISKIIDNGRYLDKIIKIMRLHKTQREDCEQHIKERKKDLGLDHFMIKN